MAHLLLIDWEKCTGCRTCTFVCPFAHERVFSPAISRIRIRKKEELGINVPVICEHCDEPPCLEVCPSGALELDGGGVIRWVEDLCTYCRSCIDACTYSALSFGELKGREILLKCDLCGGDPQCAKYCTPEALRWVERTSEQMARKKMLAESRTAKLREVP